MLQGTRGDTPLGYKLEAGDGIEARFESLMNQSFTRRAECERKIAAGTEICFGNWMARAGMYLLGLEFLHRFLCGAQRSN